jgi:aerotaxis receptor
MKQTAIPIADQARAFAIDELFFSTTDPRGIITAGNEVFVRISGYTTGELVGTAHNIIRHPDMPRAAFRLVWDRLKAGKPAAALVKNRAKDGCFYWVVALITPTPGGYLSVRFKPAGPFLPIIEGVYARMTAAERQARESGADQKTVMDEGAAVLTESLTSHKFADYDSFMWVMLCEELKSRDGALTKANRALLRALPADFTQRAQQQPALHQLGTIYATGTRAYEQLNRLYHRLDEFVSLNQTLDRKSSFVNKLTDELRISSINVALASTRLGGEGQGLAVISSHMGETSIDVADSVHGLVSGITTLSNRMRGVIFNIVSARLQVEMVLTFVHELISREISADAWAERRGLIKTLHDAFSNTMGQASVALQDLATTVHPLSAMADDLERFMLSLQVAQVTAVVESARISSHGDFLDIFVSIKEQIDQTHDELAELSDALHRLDRLAHETPLVAREIQATVNRIDQDICTLPTGSAVGAPGEGAPTARENRPTSEKSPVRRAPAPRALPAAHREVSFA